MRSFLWLAFCLVVVNCFQKAFSIHQLSNDEFQKSFIQSMKNKEYRLSYHSSSSHAFFEDASPLFSLRSDLTKRERSSPDVLHEVVFAIKQDMDALATKLIDVSSPSSLNYGRILKQHELPSITNHRSSSRIVENLLLESGVEIIDKTRNAEYIVARAPIKLWEELFSTTFYRFEQTGEKLISFNRALSYSLPPSLVSHVQSVFKTVQFPSTQKSKDYMLATSKEVEASKEKSRRLSKGSSSSGAIQATTPSLLFDFYNIPNRNGQQFGSQSVWESIQQSYDPSDLTQFQEMFNLTVEGVSEVIGGHVFAGACQPTTANCGEASLDIQYLMAIAQNLSTVYWYDEAGEGNDFLLSWAIQVANTTNPPLVFSISYGEDEKYLSKSYMDAFDTEAMKLGLMGISIIASSGDDGAVPRDTRTTALACGYSPQYPASSPYVTAIGATQGPESGLPEVVCAGNTGGIITSGGGFSERYPRPYWQQEAVAHYFENIYPAPYPGHASGRGYPDVALMGRYYEVILNGAPRYLSGTSASAPVFAGMVSLVNSKRLAAGKSPVGWLNPAIYAFANEFVNDITEGNNNCNLRGYVCCAQGYSASQGWDPTTGFGSINYMAFESTFMRIASAPGSNPTSSPTLLPETRKPSFAPTQSPTISKGWLSQTTYVGKNCEGTVDQVFQWPTETCFFDYADDGSVHGSKKYSCSGTIGGKAYVNYYSDQSCQVLSLRQEISTGCAAQVNLIYNHSTYSSEVSCVVNPDPVNEYSYPAPPMQSFAAFVNFNDDSCDSNDLSSVSLLREGGCFLLRYVSPDFPIYYSIQYPYRYMWTNNRCTQTLSGKPYDRFLLDLSCQDIFSPEPVNGGDSKSDQKSLTSLKNQDLDSESSGINYYYTSYDQIGYLAVSALSGRWEMAVGSPTPSPTEIISTSSSSSAKSKALSAEMTGVIVAVVLGVGILGGMYYYYYHQANKHKDLTESLMDKA